MKRSHREMAGSATATAVEAAPSRPSTSASPATNPKNGQAVVAISRKIRACSHCKSHKIKCDMPSGSSICVRCQRLGLDCIVNKSLQTLLDDESHWKSSMEQKTDDIQRAVSAILENLRMPPLQSPTFVPAPGSAGDSGPSVGFMHQSPQGTNGQSPGFRRTETMAMAMTRENSAEPSEQKDGVGASLVPMNSLWEVTRLRNLRSYHYQNGQPLRTGETILQEDFISRGAVDVRQAEELFDKFTVSMNQFLWGGVALKHKDFTSVRKSSSLLAAAILTVTAIHFSGNSELFDICYQEFTSLVCESVLGRYHSLDDVRALCVGAFYLSDVSWKLSGLAVRIATELNLHQSYRQALKGSPVEFERAQVWYLLYVCDHHFSIAYGRPPSTHEDISIVNCERFLQLPLIEQCDVRLQSQVSLFRILTKIYHAFSTEPDREITEGDMAQLRHFNVDLDSWRIVWQPRLDPSPYIASYPSKGVVLHYHFAKLQLNALAFRGITNYPMSADRREFANIAISSATTTLNVVLDEPDIWNALVGVPIYLHAMIAFAAMFLLKAASRWRAVGIGIDAMQVEEVVERTIGMMQSAATSDRHLTFHIANGLEKRLGRFREWQKAMSGVETTSFIPNTSSGHLPTSSMNGEEPDDGGLTGPDANGYQSHQNGYNHVNNQNGGGGGGGAAGGSYIYPGGPAATATTAFGESFDLDEQYFPVGVFDFLMTNMPE